MKTRIVPFILFWFSLNVLAATTTTTFNVTATINGACTVAASDLNFGVYNPLSVSPLNGATTVSPTCTSGTAWMIALNAGNTGTFANRLMVSGANSLQYNLYTDAGFTLIWGDGSAGTHTVSGTGNGAAQPTPVYGSIPALQNKPAGSYADLITVTLTF